MKKTVTWYVVADGAQGRIFANDGPGKGLYRAVEKDFAIGDHPPTRDIVSDREGRSQGPAGGGRHSMTAPSDAHEYEEREFLRGMAEEVGGAGLKGRFDRLVIVAAPRALGILRDLLPRAAGDKVVGELDKDLTKVPEHDLAPHLEKAGLLV